MNTLPLCFRCCIVVLSMVFLLGSALPAFGVTLYRVRSNGVVEEYDSSDPRFQRKALPDKQLQTGNMTFDITYGDPAGGRLQ